MPFNGSGIFNLIFNWEADAAANIDIMASRMDQQEADMASSGFDNCLTRDGQGQPTANLPMAGFRHTNVGNGVNRTDYASLGQVQDDVGINWVPAGGSANAITATYAPVLTALTDGQLAFFRATAANTTTTPTFSPNSLTAHTITRFGGTAVAIGDIPGALAECILRYNLANTRWELLNPAVPSVPLLPATSFFVTATGSDSTGNGSSGTPWATIEHAINQIFSFTWGGQVVTLNVGAGSFAAFNIIGLGPISSGTTSVNQLGLVIVGAGSGSTTIAANNALQGARLELSAVTVDCTATNNAFSGDASSNLVLAGDVIFSGNSASAVALNFNQFSSVIQTGNVSLAGTIGTYFSGFAGANYEQNSGNLTVSGGATVSTLLVLDTLSNYHFFGGGLVVSGTTNSNVYAATGGSVVAAFGSIAMNTIWAGGGGSSGILQTGARSEGAVTQPTVAASTGAAAVTTGSNASSTIVTLTISSGTPTTGTISITVNEFLCLTPGVSSAYSVTLQGGTVAWPITASVRISSVSATSGGRTYVIAWAANGTGLSNGTYLFNFIGQT